MKFVTQTTWEAPLARVLAMLTDPRYATLKLELMSYDSFQVLSTHQEGDIYTVVTHIVGKPSIKLPSLAQRFIKADQGIEIEQTDCWNRATATGTLVLNNKSISVVAISAKMALTESAGVTTNTINWTVECSLPLIGGKLADILSEDIRSKAENNERVSRQVLAESF